MWPKGARRRSQDGAERNPGLNLSTWQRHPRFSLALNPGYKPQPRRWLLFQEYVVRRIGRRERRPGLVAGAIDLAALGIDALNCSHAGERAGAARLYDLELEPGNVLLGCTVGATGRLADDTAAVCMLPGWAHIMPADGFAVHNQGRNRLAELPGKFAAFAGLAVIDLRPLGMHRQYDGFALGCDGVGDWGIHLGGLHRRDRAADQSGGGGKATCDHDVLLPIAISAHLARKGGLIRACFHHVDVIRGLDLRIHPFRNERFSFDGSPGQARLDPAIHLLAKKMDPRVKPAGDGRIKVAPPPTPLFPCRDLYVRNCVMTACDQFA